MFSVGAAVVLIILTVLAFIVMKIFFSVKQIEVKGDAGWTVDELIEASDIKEGDLMLFVNSGKAQKAVLKKFRMIESVSIEREMPDKIIFTVKKERPLFWSANGEYALSGDKGTSYTVVSESEKIIDIFPTLEEMRERYGVLPEVMMPEARYAVLGEKIGYREEGDSLYIPGLIKAVKASFFDGDDLLFDLRVRFDIVIYSGIADDGKAKYELRFGNYKRYEEKIRLAQSIAKEKLDASFKGVISVETSGNDPVKEAYARAR
ncbi:MAG: FtsQ-type POTRA domain-containing protein [Clostridia bacterium]|nr:FtsQ-type POTRA domain-containing protein [Clostridia bacterium]